LVKGNWTSPSAPPSLGHAPVHYGSTGFPVYHYGQVQYEQDAKAKRTRIVGPYLSFETERPAMRTFRSMLRILAKRDFPFVADFDGPELGITRPRDQVVWVDEVLERLVGMDDTDVPSLLGIRAELMYEHDRDVTVKLKVKVGDGTKVKLKVRGTVNKSTWNHIRADIKRKFHVIV
jgi:hypothetical protein